MFGGVLRVFVSVLGVFEGVFRVFGGVLGVFVGVLMVFGYVFTGCLEVSYRC